MDANDAVPEPGKTQRFAFGAVSTMVRGLSATLALVGLMIALPLTLHTTAMVTRIEDRVAIFARAIVHSAPFSSSSTGASFGDPGNKPGQILCNGVGDADAMMISRAVALMRSTKEGSALYRDMLSNDVCVTVANLGNRAGLAHGIPSDGSGWQWSFITIDSDHIRQAAPDILAATLIHEATHIARAIDGVDCWHAQTCTELPNGVLLEEEIEAHAAEARFWIARYGEDGTSGTGYGDAWQNEIAARYLAGPETFVAYIYELRSADAPDIDH